MKLLKSKKGFIGDIALFSIMLFAMVILLVVLYYTYTQVNNAWQSNSNIPSESKSIMAYQSSKFLSVWDGWIIVALVGYLIALVISALAIRTHPVFGGLALLVLIAIGVVAVNLANAYYSFATGTPGLSAAAEAFSKSGFVMNNLPYFIIGFGIIFIIVLYAKSRSQVSVL